MNSKLLNHPITHLLLIVGLGSLAYSNSFGVPFVLDDLESIVRNESIRNLGNFLPGGAGLEFHFRRWVAYFTFALNYQFGGENVAGYHAVNLAVHLGTALLLYALVRLTFRTPLLSASRLAPQAGVAASVAALFFVVHPVQTQAVTYIVQRLTSLCTLFYLLALVLYAWGRLRQVESGHGSPITNHGSRFPQHLLLFTASVLAAVLAMFTKELAFTLPFAALLYETCFFRGAWRPRLAALLPLLLTLPIIPVLVFTGGELSAASTLQQTRVDIPRWHYLLTQFPVIITYLRLLILPIDQNLDYDYPVYTTFFTPPVFLSFLLLSAIFALVPYLFWRTRSNNSTTMDHGSRITDHEANTSPLTPHSSRLSDDPSSRLIAFGIAWFFLTLAVESSFVPLADVIFEHRLYLPSVGLATALGVATCMAREKTAGLLGGWLPLLVAALAIAALTVASWQRNLVWGSQLSLWEDTVRKSPEKGRPWYNLGTYLMGLGQLDEALHALTQSVQNDPGYAEAWHNLGLTQLMAGRYQGALLPLQRAVRLDPDLVDAKINLAIALLYTNQPSAAVSHLENVRQRFPERGDLRYNLGMAYLGSGDLPSARGELAALKGVAPDLATALEQQINLAVTNTSAQ